MLIAETPNRLIPHDGHSTSLHFFQSLPTELAIAYIDRSPRQDAKAVASAADPVEALYRFGMGASYHEFELYFSGADGKTPSIVSDGWDFWQAFDEPIRRDELALADYFPKVVDWVEGYAQDAGDAQAFVAAPWLELHGL